MNKPDALLYKIDVARAFQNLRANPVDATKFGIFWKRKYYLDHGIVLDAWEHGIKDGLRHSHTSGCTVCEYIEDYIGVLLIIMLTVTFENSLLY